MKRKEVEDVMGGKDAWANVDKTDGMAPSKERWQKRNELQPDSLTSAGVYRPISIFVQND